MAVYSDEDHYSAKSAADLSTKRLYICKTDSNGKVILATAATDKFLGVIFDGGRVSADNVDVMLINGDGTFKVIAGGTISKDDYLTSDSNGKGITTVTSGNHVFGQAMSAAVAGQEVEYLKKDFLIA